MDYQIFEIMLLFSIYSILGWLAIGLSFALAGKGFRNRSLCSGPYQPGFGLGALIVLYGADYIQQIFPIEQMWEPILFLGLGFVTGAVLSLVRKILINGSCGHKLLSFHWYFPFLTGLSAVILGLHLNGLISAYIRWVPSWIHLIFLLIFWTKFLSQFMDVLFSMRTFKKRVHLLLNHE